MPQDQTKVRSFGDRLVNVFTARQTATPATPTLAGTSLATSVTSGVYSAGFLVDGRIEEALDVQSTQKYAQGGVQIRTLRSQVVQTWQFACAQTDAVTIGLERPGVIGTVAVPGVAETQTITVTGSPTGGSFNVTVPGYGTVSVARNAPTNTGTGNVQDLLSQLLGYAVSVSGTAGSSYAVTAPAAQGDIPAFLVDGSALTGGTSPSASVATTTPGTTPIYQHAVSPSIYTTPNDRFFWIDLVDGVRPQNSHRLHLPNAEAVRSGNKIAGIDEDWETPFTLTAYPDQFGISVYDWTADPAFGPAAQYA